MDARGDRPWGADLGGASLPFTLLLPPNACGVAPMDGCGSLAPGCQMVMPPGRGQPQEDTAMREAPLLVLVPGDGGREACRVQVPPSYQLPAAPPARDTQDPAALSSLLYQYLQGPRRQDPKVGAGRMVVRAPVFGRSDVAVRRLGPSCKDSGETDPSIGSMDGMSTLENNAEEVTRPPAVLRKTSSLGSRGRWDRPGVDAATSKEEKRRERNRRAQRNFRERQRNRIVDLEEELQRLKERVRRLEVEYAQLNRENQLVKQCVGYPAAPREAYRQEASSICLANIEDQLFDNHAGGALLQTANALSR